jgi:hypothetical protein
MSYTMTYDSLLTDVRNYLERGFTAESDAIVFEQIPRLITLAERRISTELKIQGFIRAVQTPLSVGVSIYQKPDRWRDTISMEVNGKILFARAYEFLRTYWPDPTATAAPEFYADYDYFRWLIVPTPNAVTTLDVIYYEQPRLLGDDFQTNWITAYQPRLLLYATMIEAAPFLKNDERVATWQSLFDREAQSIDGEDLKRILDRSSNRTEA